MISSSNRRRRSKSNSLIYVLASTLCLINLNLNNAFNFHPSAIRIRRSIGTIPGTTIELKKNQSQNTKTTTPYSSITFALSSPLDLIGREQGESDNNNNNSEYEYNAAAAVHSQGEHAAHHDHVTMTDSVVMAGTTLMAILTLMQIIKLSGPGAWRYYIAGGICAATSHAIPTPIDVVKTRKQVDPELQGKGFLRAAHELIRKEGPQSMLAGLGPTTIGYLLEGAVKFGVYEALKPIVKSMLSSIALGAGGGMQFLKSQLMAFVISASVAGTAASLLLCPMEALRIRMVSEPNFAPNGFLEGGYKMLKYEGVSGLWKGTGPMIYKQVPYTVTKNVSFDFLTKYAYAFIKCQGMTLSSTITFAVPFISAAIASILSCISSQPGDMLLSLVNAHGGEKTPKDFAKDIIRSDKGLRGFFVGMSDRLLHVGVIVTLQLLIYDFVKRMCGIAATGAA